MRISDWSSDVCSSDLDTRRGGVGYEVVLPRARSGMDCSRARQLDERVDFGDAVFHRLEGADRLAEGAPGQCIVACGFEQLFGPAGLFVRGDDRLQREDMDRRRFGDGTPQQFDCRRLRKDEVGGAATVVEALDWPALDIRKPAPREAPFVSVSRVPARTE